MNDNELYVEHVRDIGSLQVWRINGFYLRDQSPETEAFTDSGQCYQFKFIPCNQLWVDSEIQSDELNFVIDNVLWQYIMMSNGMNYEDALDVAVAHEKTERSRSYFASIAPRTFGSPQMEFIRQARKEFLGTILNGVQVWLVRGDIVRNRDENFVDGGHSLVYRAYIPPNNIWLDDASSSAERPYVLIHEASEYRYMAQGLSYDDAHQLASKIEFECREDPSLANTTLEELGWHS